jgi:arylsulfatase A-like enzyme
MFTSLHTSSHHCWDFRSSLDDSYTTLAEMLSERGWFTAAVVSHEFMREKYGLHQGFEHYDRHLAQASAYSHKAISSPNVTNRTLRWMSKRVEAGRTDPWFLWVHYFDPHLQYLEHPGSRQFGTDTDSDLYDGEVRFTDQHLGRLLAELKTMGQLDDTIIVFIADHGEEFGDHGGIKHGKTLYREVTRVPFAIRAPGLAPRRVSDPVSLVDVTPTLLELLGVEDVQVGFTGRSLVPLMLGLAEPTPPVLLELDMGGFSMRAVVFERWKLVEVDLEQGGLAHELYDRVADPSERHDVAADNPDVVIKLAELLAAEVAAAAEVGRIYAQGDELTLDEDELQRLEELGYR